FEYPSYNCGGKEKRHKLKRSCVRNLYQSETFPDPDLLTASPYLPLSGRLQQRFSSLHCLCLPTAWAEYHRPASPRYPASPFPHPEWSYPPRKDKQCNRELYQNKACSHLWKSSTDHAC